MLSGLRHHAFVFHEHQSSLQDCFVLVRDTGLLTSLAEINIRRVQFIITEKRIDWLKSWQFVKSVVEGLAWMLGNLRKDNGIRRLITDEVLLGYEGLDWLLLYIRKYLSMGSCWLSGEAVLGLLVASLVQIYLRHFGDNELSS